MAKPGHIYHWKHGWIPITPRAAMIKAKGNRHTAALYAHRYGIEDRRTGGPDRRKPGGEGADSFDRPGMRSGQAGPTSRGGFQYKPGTKTRDYPDRAPVAHEGGGTLPGGPRSADEAFRMKRSELEPHAKAGNPHAVAELERRAAKHGPGGRGRREFPKAEPKQPTPRPTPPPVDDRNSKPIQPVPEPHQPKVNTGELDPADVEREDAAINAALPHGESVIGSVSHRYEDTPGQFSGYRAVPAVRSTHYRDTGTGTGAKAPVGYVIERGNGQFAAQHRYLPHGRKDYKIESIGTFGSRLEAHKAISAADAAHRAEAEAKAAKAAEAARRKAAKLGGIAGPNGTTWEPFTVPDDGTFTGKMVAAKAKQAFKAGDHTVIIESALSETETKGLLSDITSAVNRAHPNLGGAGVKFLVPTGDRTFSSTRGGIVGAYVHVGGTTVHINPGVANRKHAAAFAAGGERGHFMPAAKHVAPREYTILHELGHVADNVHGHTRSTTSGRSLFGAGGFNPGVLEHHREATHAHAASAYSKANPAEGYAEAFAQFHVSGPGSHPLSDAYAERYGWNMPEMRPDEGAMAVRLPAGEPTGHPMAAIAPQVVRTHSVQGHEVQVGDTYVSYGHGGRGGDFAGKVQSVKAMPDGSHVLTFAGGYTKTVPAGEPIKVERVVPGATPPPRKRTKADVVREAREKYGNGSPQHLAALRQAQGRRR